MWCVKCQADVAAEVLPGEIGGDRVRCAVCGEETPHSGPGRSSTKTEQARELLRRWSSENLLDPFDAAEAQPSTIKGETPPQGASAFDSRGATSEVAAGPALSPGSQSLTDRSSPFDSRPLTFEMNTAMSAGEAPHLPGSTVDAKRAESETHPTGAGEPSPHERRAVHAAHAGHSPLPHFEVQTAIEEEHSRKANWTAFCGQILAYLGVGGLTVGTTLVLWGYFGGPQSYTPTGWLVATAGQMLLFLGVVTLVSGGMEQTTQEVSRRLDRMGERLIRIERAAYESQRPGTRRSRQAAASTAAETNRSVFG